ncbi:hypothetical protein [Phycicoccus avicenniae]|uniref:hypothetical protein n=1 Tax=Phycicoccus avicenniae TaxID=2828860 RepID=UPI003D28D110
MDKAAMWVRGLLTLLLLGLAVWWLTLVAREMSTAPTVGKDGKVLLDEFQRAKDILLVVLPLLTTALGYWFGAAGKEKAEEGKAKAEATAEQKAQQLDSVLDAAPQGVLKDAKDKHPEAFGLPRKG